MIERDGLAAAIQEIERIATGASEPAVEQIPLPDGVMAVAVGTATSLIVPAIERHLPRPRRKRAEVGFTELAGFVAYLQAHRTPATVVMAKLTDSGVSLVAHLDFHQPGPAGEPSWCEHRAVLTPELSPQWRAWTGKSGQAQSQDDIADFLDENVADVVSPLGADLLAVCRDLRATSGAKMHRQIHANGGVAIRYTEDEEVAAGRPGDNVLQVPSEFTIRVPVFRGGPAYDIRASLRTRLAESRLRITYKLQRTADHVEAEARRMIAELTTQTGLVAMVGEVRAVNTINDRHEVIAVPKRSD